MIPPLIKVRQEIPAPELKDPGQALRKKLKNYEGAIQRGQQVAIACGSRGVSRMSELVRTLADWVRGQGGKPFIIPAMGSHGASTSEGQKHVLEELGLSEAAMNCPVRSEINARKIGRVKQLDVFTDRNALKADHLILINRIKPHTSFHARHESGLVKMLAIGLGKRQGAEQVHKFGPERLGVLIPAVAGFLLDRLPVLFGVALLENYREQLAGLELIAARDFFKREPSLLKRAYRLMPRLPFSELDVLVVDKIGKDLSGTGMDTNVIGRLDLRGMKDPSLPRVRRIVALDLSEKTAGSAYGIGLADITTRRVIDKMDYNSVRENALASTFVERARTPLWFESDRAAIEAAVKTCWQPDLKKVRACRIKSTLELDEFWITENLLAAAKARLKIIARKSTLAFDREGKLRN
jgi:hypothetical protein